jgi:hypothetical protein
MNQTVGLQQISNSPPAATPERIHEANALDVGIAHGKPKIVQATNDAITATSWVFSEQFDDELFEFRIHRRSSDWVDPGECPLFLKPGLEPTEQGVWSKQRFR